MLEDNRCNRRKDGSKPRPTVSLDETRLWGSLWVACSEVTGNDSDEEVTSDG